MNRSSATGAALGGYVTACFAFIFAPFVFLVLFAFNESRFPYWPFQSFSLQWFEAMQSTDLLLAIGHSLVVAAITAVMATLLGATAAYYVYRWSPWFRSPYLALILTPPCVPLIVLALMMLMYLKQLGLAKTLVSVVICHVVLTAPFAFGLVRLRLSQLHPDCEPAAWNLGASRWTALRTVVVPQILPALLAAGCLTAAVSWDEFTVSWFVSGLDITLPVYLWNKFQGQVSAVVNAIGTVCFLGSAVMIIAFETLFAHSQAAPVEKESDHE